jgi:hypothetical protein
VWNLTVENEHNYIANGFVVSNCDCMVKPKMFSRDEFNRKLKDYIKGEPTEGAAEISRWAQKYGLGEGPILGTDPPSKSKLSKTPGGTLAIPQKEDIIKTALGVPKGEPMNPNDALAGSNLDGYKDNCQRCVPAYELRRRGYDVTAMSYDKNSDIIYDGSECLLNNKKEKIKLLRVINGKADLIKILKNYPDGARFGIYQYWESEANGHVYIVEKFKDTLKFIDPQSNKKNVASYLDDISGNRGNKRLWIYRMDNAVLNQAVDWAAIVRAAKEKTSNMEKLKNETKMKTLSEAKAILEDNQYKLKEVLKYHYDEIEEPTKILVCETGVEDEECYGFLVYSIPASTSEAEIKALEAHDKETVSKARLLPFRVYKESGTFTINIR